MADPRMETYNYYRDSRVQAAMFSSCWKIVHQESDSAVVCFDADWVLDSLCQEKLEEIVGKWVEDEEEFTEAYRDLRSRAEDRKTSHDDALKEIGPLWKSSTLEKERVKALYQDFSAASKLAAEEYGKLYDRAESENPTDSLHKQMGFEMFRSRDGEETFPCCMRVETKFEVCGQCQGSGQVVNPSIDCGGLSQEDFDEDPDFEVAYFSGQYDITCPTCRGKRVETIPQLPEWLNIAIQGHDESQWDGIQEQCAELAMGA